MTRHPPIGAENFVSLPSRISKKADKRGCDEAISAAAACGFNLGLKMDLGQNIPGTSYYSSTF